MKKLESVIVIGYPGDVGGADTELWHVLRLWQRHNLSVTLIPTWHAPDRWRRRCDAIGVPTIDIADPKCLEDVWELHGAIVVSFCNGEFLKHAGRFRRLACRIVWVGCMTWLFPAEREYYAVDGPFDAYVFQSQYQSAILGRQLAPYGVLPRQCHHIPGAIDAEQIPFDPNLREVSNDFVVGRMARPDVAKWSGKTWEVYGAITHPRRRARLMGVTPRIAAKLGEAPPWAELLPPAAEPVGEFLRSLHCLLAINGGAAENWPRAGLESMAAGVPVVTQNAWGWREMIDHGHTGFLASNDDELASFATRLAFDESYRLKIATQARERLINELANPDDHWQRWKRLFESLER